MSEYTVNASTEALTIANEAYFLFMLAPSACVGKM